LVCRGGWCHSVAAVRTSGPNFAELMTRVLCAQNLDTQDGRAITHTKSHSNTENACGQMIIPLSSHHTHRKVAAIMKGPKARASLGPIFPRYQKEKGHYSPNHTGEDGPRLFPTWGDHTKVETEYRLELHITHA